MINLQPEYHEGSPMMLPALQPDTHPMTAAIAYSRAGMFIGRMEQRSKNPGSVLGKGWHTKTTNDWEIVRDVWADAAEGRDGIFFHCGRSGAVVLDVDRPENIPSEWWEWLDRAPFQSTRANDPRRGHYFFLMPKGRTIGSPNMPFGAGEVRGKNGVVVLGPTVHEKVASGARYLVVRGGEMFALPEAVASLLSDDGNCGQDSAASGEVDKFMKEFSYLSGKWGETHPWKLEYLLGDGSKTGRDGNPIVGDYQKAVRAGGSRHQAAVTIACEMARRCAAGQLSADTAFTALESVFRGSFDPARDGRLRGSRAEWQGIQAWAIGQCTPERVEEEREKQERYDIAYRAKKAASTASVRSQTPIGAIDPDRYFDQSPDKKGLLVKDLADDVQRQYPCALTKEGAVATYRNGVFTTDNTAMRQASTEFLQNRFRPGYNAALQDYLVGSLAAQGIRLPEHVGEPLLNVKNGMLDLRTGELHPHSPKYLSSAQLPVEWDPDAQCPTYEAWTEKVGITSQLDDLEESTSTMLDRSRTPTKAVFLFGKSRSGKSTYIRLIEHLVGSSNRSAISLHLLSQDRFSAANIYGKMLNCCADMSSANIEDVSLFKQLTGNDTIPANRKYGAQFQFKNTALFMFSANTLPTVSENSQAYSLRIKPFQFDLSFAGCEDPTIEEQMVDKELPGILVRLVRAWQRKEARGEYQKTDAVVAKRFEDSSDRVRQFISDHCAIREQWSAMDPDEPVHEVVAGCTVPPNFGTTVMNFARAFNRWADDNQSPRMGTKAIRDRLSSMDGVVEVRMLPSKTRGINIDILPEV